MSIRINPQRLMVPSLCLLLMSCSATRPTLAGPSGPQDLAEYVLIIQEKPDGQPLHEWRPAQDIDLSQYPYGASRKTGAGRILRATFTRDCEEELHACYQDCMSRPLPPGYGGIKIPRKAGGKAEWCNKKCLQPYNDCCRLRELKAQRFETIGPAVEWAKQYREQILTGTVIIIAGVTFVAFGGPGILILAPVSAVLLTSGIETAPADALNQERL
ncbi:hypothetical protein ATI61_10511 [Archangium gephyra]|uniref:Lipoprotein n=1 Tax=Archangium gephyra TaxID=48 RepID=A0ABX9K1A9_9BACT|nr:hypothetical protein [Archangium gephyra]REG31687.1 hypothetical protein ATI61_10511 [Archangium gephyra]